MLENLFSTQLARPTSLPSIQLNPTEMRKIILKLSTLSTSSEDFVYQLCFLGIVFLSHVFLPMFFEPIENRENVCHRYPAGCDWVHFFCDGRSFQLFDFTLDLL